MKLQVKEVNFDGKKIIAIREDGKVYVSVKSVCNNLGMNREQYVSQRNKISKDELLKGGIKLCPLETNGGKQRVLMLELDYLPIWLAKINPSRFSEELKKQLIEYQLKAKDVLADEFLGKRISENSVRYEPELNEIEDRAKRIRENRDSVRKLLVQIADDYDWIKQRADLGYERAKGNYQETKRTHFILENRNLTTEDIDRLNSERLEYIEKRLND